MSNGSFNRISINPRQRKSNEELSEIDYTQNSIDFYMDDFVLKKLIKSIYNNLNSDVIQFNWIGNLNCSINIEFYNKVVALQNGCFGKNNYLNVIETSILLIDYDSIKFFSENDVTLRILIKESLFNNQNKEDLKLVEKNIFLLRKHSVSFDVEVSCEDCNFEFVEIIYNFLKNNEIYWSSLSSDVSNAKNKVNSKKYGEFLCRLFDMWYDDLKMDIPSNNIFISLFDSILYSYINGIQTICQFKMNCGFEIFINAEGDVYPCIHCDDETKFVGNILNGNLFLMLNSSKMEKFRQKKSKISYECKLCKWKGLCNGGCPKTRVKDSCDKEKTYLCEGYKKFFEHTNDRFSKLSKLVQN